MRRMWLGREIFVAGLPPLHTQNSFSFMLSTQNIYFTAEIFISILKEENNCYVDDKDNNNNVYC